VALAVFQPGSSGPTGIGTWIGNGIGTGISGVVAAVICAQNWIGFGGFVIPIWAHKFVTHFLSQPAEQSANQLTQCSHNVSNTAFDLARCQHLIPILT